jgi:alpha-L-rhamnosidase
MGVSSVQYQKVVHALKSDIKANNGHLDTGIFGTQFFFEVLAENGMNELAYEVMNNRTEPGYGHWLELGSTTTREQWSESGSHNHPMFGGGLVWLYRKLAGMNADPMNPGYRHIIFRPQIVDDLSYVSYSNLTPFGRAGISWKNENTKFTMEVIVPVGSIATIYLPAESLQQITEGGKKAEALPEIDFLKMDLGYAVFTVGSGRYNFEVD